MEDRHRPPHDGSATLLRRRSFPGYLSGGGGGNPRCSSLRSKHWRSSLRSRSVFPATGTDSKKLINLVPTWTDNRGNGSALNKLMSTRYPASALLMELASHMKHEKMKASVSWAPREVNREADRLANGDTTGFDPNLRLHIDVSNAHVVCSWAGRRNRRLITSNRRDFFQRLLDVRRGRGKATD